MTTHFYLLELATVGRTQEKIGSSLRALALIESSLRVASRAVFVQDGRPAE